MSIKDGYLGRGRRQRGRWGYIMETVLDITEGNAGGDGVNIPSPRTQKSESVRSAEKLGWGHHGDF